MVAYGTLFTAHNLNHGHFRWFWRDLGCANPAPSQLGQSQPVPERRSTHKDTLGIPIVCRHETGCPDSSSHSYSQLGQAGHPDDQNGVKGFLWELWMVKTKACKEIPWTQYTQFHSQSGQIWCEHLFLFTSQVSNRQRDTPNPHGVPPPKACTKLRLPWTVWCFELI